MLVLIFIKWEISFFSEWKAAAHPALSPNILLMRCSYEADGERILVFSSESAANNEKVGIVTQPFPPTPINSGES